MRLSLSFLPDFLVLGCVLGTENRLSQAPELTGDGQRLSLCGDVNTEVSADRGAPRCWYGPGRAFCVRWQTEVPRNSLLRG